MPDDPLRPDEVTFDLVDAAGEEARWCTRQYLAELDRRFPGGFDTTGVDEHDVAAFRPPGGCFVVLHARGEAVGCGALATIGPGIGEVKRMWVADRARGLGLGRRLLEHLEALARERGDHLMRLDTNGTLDSAIALYESSGYRRVDRYNDNPYAELFFEKALATGDAP